MLTILLSFLSIILIDIVLSGDNAIIVGTVAASLPESQRNKAIIFGMGVAMALRVVLTIGAMYLLMIPGLQLFGGLLLVYICYGMYKDLTDDDELNDSTDKTVTRSFMSAMVAITLADLSMSLDNVMAVAAAANSSWVAIIFGLVLSVAIMGAGAKLVSTLIHKHKWIAWVGLTIISLLSIKMIYHGSIDLIHYFA